MIIEPSFGNPAKVNVITGTIPKSPRVRSPLLFIRLTCLGGHFHPLIVAMLSSLLLQHAIKDDHHSNIPATTPASSSSYSNGTVFQASRSSKHLFLSRMAFSTSSIDNFDYVSSKTSTSLTVRSCVKLIKEGTLASVRQGDVSLPSMPF